MNTAKLKLARGEKGLTLQELGKLTGLTYVQICKLERGQVENPHIKTILKLARALEVRPEELL